MDSDPDLTQEPFPGFREEFTAINTSAFSDVDYQSLGKEILARYYGFELSPPPMEGSGPGFPQFIQKEGERFKVVVKIWGWTPLSAKYFDEVYSEIRKLADMFEPQILVFMVFHFIDNDLESKLKSSLVSSGKSPDSDFIIIDINWIVERLREYTDIDDRYFPVVSITGRDKPVQSGDMVIWNRLQKSVIDNDTSLFDRDLLGFENDLRAFASTIALRETKPPLAIALLGNWGTGKSFFMHNLAKKVEYLSQNQGFSERGPNDSNISGPVTKPYCEGVVQIKFNAWSYLDANLWAGLVVNIFEKLDQYITEKTKGDEQKLKAQKILSEKLAIVSDEKQNLLNEGSQLAADKDEMMKELETRKGEKDKLYDEFLRKQKEDLKKEVLKKAGELAGPLKDELERQGIRKEDIEKMSPSELYEEARSWLVFFRNIGKFNLRQLALFVIIIVVLLYLWYFPFSDLPPTITSGIIKFIITAIGIAAPVYRKIISAVNAVRELAAPLKEYKDRFNQALIEAEAEWQADISSLQNRISEKESRISEIEHSLSEAGRKIEYYNYALEHSITKRAFCSFIQEKVHDLSYTNSLGIISVIRRDFEILSELFSEIVVPEKISGEERDALKKKKELSDEFRDNFDKPLERIVLYIDDLDRCPDEKVLDVLQAVHLLMAYPLFIVVVGVDKRCVYNALTYKNLIQYSSYTDSRDPEDLARFGINVIHPYEYLEKIFQISFHLKEATGPEIEQMVSTLLENQVEKTAANESRKEEASADVMQDTGASGSGDQNRRPAGAEDVPMQQKKEAENRPISISIEDLKITDTELVFLKEISWLAGNRPRTIKRFVNIYRLIRTHEQLSYSQENREDDFLAVMFLLAIILGPHKESAGRLFHELESKTTRKISTCMSKASDELVAIREKISDCRNIKHLLAFRNTRLVKYLPFIKRFSFEYEDESSQPWKTQKPQQKKA